MAILLPPLSGTSAVRNQFLEPLRAGYLHATTIRNCPAESDWEWLTKGVDRVLSNVRSGRDFLQTFQRFWHRELQGGPCFETLSSERRLAMVAAGGCVPANAAGLVCPLCRGRSFPRPCDA